MLKMDEAPAIEHKYTHLCSVSIVCPDLSTDGNKAVSNKKNPGSVLTFTGFSGSGKGL